MHQIQDQIRDTPTQGKPDRQRRRVVSYAQQRASRMTPGQRRGWERNWDRLGRDITDLPEGPLDTTGWFGRCAPVVLEIGPGMGESTATMAAAAPDVDHLAVEVYQPGLAQLLLRAEHAHLTNLRLLRGDAQELLTEHIALASLRGVRIYFPDPWPKRRHHKRRLVDPEFVTLVASRLEPGGTLHLATDWEPYAAQMRAAGAGEPMLRNTGARDTEGCDTEGCDTEGCDTEGTDIEGTDVDGYTHRPAWRPVSKFEQRALDEGRTVRDLLFSRI